MLQRESDGLEANIQPVNAVLVAVPGSATLISRKAALSGGSVGGVFRQARAVIRKVPKATSVPIGSRSSLVRAVILSSACSSATRLASTGPSACASGTAPWTASSAPNPIGAASLTAPDPPRPVPSARTGR